MIEMQLSRIVIRETTDQQCVYLREKGGAREFPIVIGIFEAMAIDRKVRDRATREPATEETARIVNGLRARRVLISAAGPAANVLKIRPPLVFSQENADLFLAALDEVVTDVANGSSS